MASIAMRFILLFWPIMSWVNNIAEEIEPSQKITHDIFFIHCYRFQSENIEKHSTIVLAER